MAFIISYMIGKNFFESKLIESSAIVGNKKGGIRLEIFKKLLKFYHHVAVIDNTNNEVIRCIMKDKVESVNNLSARDLSRQRKIIIAVLAGWI